MDITLPPRKCRMLIIHNKWKECDDYTYTMQKYDGNLTTLEVVGMEKDIGCTSIAICYSTSIFKSKSTRQIK